MPTLRTKQLSLIALGITLNYVGGFLALSLKLPIYLDTIGTLTISAFLGPFYGAITGFFSGLISGITTDIYALYFSPVQIITGLLGGFLFHRHYFKKCKLPLGIFILTLPATTISSIIAAYLFNGITSSGSSLIVQLLHQLGLNMPLSVFLVQIVTDYLDRLIGISIVLVILKTTPLSFKNKLEGKDRHEAI